MLLVPGQVQNELYFVKEGVQMSFFDADQKSHVIAFTYAPDLCAIPDSFLLQIPSGCFLTCLTDSTFDFLTFAQLQEVFHKSANMERLFRKMTEYILAGMINRHIELHSRNMEIRFLEFCRRSPHLLNRVPHKYLASYLGIDPTNFSKLFNRLKI